MSAEIYEIVAQGARYWFFFLMALIVWRSYRWLAKDRRQRRKRMRLLPDAGYVGEMVVLTGNDQLPRGQALPVPAEGVLGFTRMSDLCVPVNGVAKRHCWLCYDQEAGLLVEPFFGCTVTVDGQERTGRRDPLPMGHGSRLRVGEAELRLRLFAGYETAASARERSWEDEGDRQPAPPQAMTPEQLALWQQQALWQMQQQAVQQAQYAQWLAAQAAQASGAPEDGGDEPPEEPPYGPPDGGEAEEDAAPGAAVSPGRAPNAADRLLTADAYCPTAGFSPQVEFDPGRPLYPPALDEAEAEALWPDVGQADDPDEDMTDAAAPPKSAYVGQDEAETAKRVFWDKYLGGGDRR